MNNRCPQCRGELTDVEALHFEAMMLNVQAGRLGDLNDSERNCEVITKLRHILSVDPHHACSQKALGCAYSDGLGVAQDAALAVEWWRKAAEQGLDVAQYNLGVAYHGGTGVAQDEALAVGWCKKAAKQGHAHAQYNLHRAYHEGKGVVQDAALAVEWCKKAAKQGVAKAQYSLGQAYHDGKGVVQHLTVET